MLRATFLVASLLAITAIGFVQARPTLGKNQGLISHSSDEDQLERCFSGNKLSTGRLLLTWYSAENPLNPLKYLRNIMADDLDLPNLVFTINQAQLHRNGLLFEMSRILDASKVLRNYCNLFVRTTEYRSQGYDEPALKYEISATDLDFSNTGN